MKVKRRKKGVNKYKVIAIVVTLFVIFSVVILKVFSIIPTKEYSSDTLGIKTIKSSTDKDKDGIDDYTDIMLGAREYVQSKPKYKSGYYEGGYPPKGEGVCTDVIWYGFKKAGYNLKDLVDKDIKNNISKYPRVEGSPDTNIDFRRVPNLLVFFNRNAKSLTTDITKVEQWQAGDIIVFGDSHIGIVSDKRNKNGEIFIIHQSKSPIKEEYAKRRYNSISGHFRWEKQ